MEPGGPVRTRHDRTPRPCARWSARSANISGDWPQHQAHVSPVGAVPGAYLAEDRHEHAALVGRREPGHGQDRLPAPPVAPPSPPRPGRKRYPPGNQLGRQTRSAIRAAALVPASATRPGQLAFEPDQDRDAATPGRATGWRMMNRISHHSDRANCTARMSRLRSAVDRRSPHRRRERVAVVYLRVIVTAQRQSHRMITSSACAELGEG